MAAAGEHPFLMTAQSFPRMRRVIKRLRFVLSWSPHSIPESNDEESELQRFQFPATRKSFRPLSPETGAEILPMSPGPTPNARMPSLLAAPVAEEIDADESSSTACGNNSISVQLNNDDPDQLNGDLTEKSIQRHSPSIASGFEAGPSDRGLSPPSVSTQDGRRTPQSPSISKRLLCLRPPGSKSLDRVSVTKSIDDGRPKSAEIVEQMGSIPQPSPSKAERLAYIPVIQTTQPSISGSLSEKEWLFYKNYSGSWLLDKACSDDLQPFIDVLEVTPRGGGNQRSMKIGLDEKHVRVSMVISGSASVVEDRPWTGARVPNNRRDLWHGGAECWVERYPQGLLFRTKWSGYNAADIYESLEMMDDYMHLVIRQDIYRSTGKVSQRRIVWHRRLT